MTFRPERYRALVDDWGAFSASLRRPLPLTLWANPLRTTPEEARRWLEAEGLHPEPLPWRPGAFRLPPGEAPAPGSLLATVAGLVHVQEEVSLLPVALLDPRPGERVIDLCAAPGSKASQIAAAMAGRGTLVANDADWRRQASLGRNLERLGAENAVLTVYDAANFPEAGGPFDRVLADVPCTCEGTSRKNPEVFTWGDESDRPDTVRTQRAILRKAVRLCRPGGRIVYSTCTYAPEENEAVIDSVLREAPPGGLRVLEARIEGLRSVPGVPGWEGEAFDPALARAMRVWPHANDTGGFFVAVLEKGGGEPGAAREPELLELEPVEAEPWLAPVRERFGLAPELFAGRRLVARGRGVLAMVSDDLRAPARPEPSSLGLAFLYREMRNPKLTTAAAMAFGAAATRSFVELDEGELRRYLARQDQELPADRVEAGSEPGYVLARHRGVCFGVGWLRPATAGGRASLRSLFPKRWAASGE
jgi:16S rRNA C967 or C1407 C5-methylase (RsmB/RsmF family)